MNVLDKYALNTTFHYMLAVYFFFFWSFSKVIYKKDKVLNILKSTVYALLQHV